jgi:excisionase family DNA binding protein
MHNGLDVPAWAKYLREASPEACAEALIKLRQLAVIAETMLLLHRSPPIALDAAPPTGRRLLTLPEASRLLKVSEDTAREWGRTGRIPVVKIGRRVRVPSDALEEICGFGRKK